MKIKSLLLTLLLFVSPLFAAHLRLTDKDVTPNKLSEELIDAGLPVIGVGRLARDIDEDGKAVLTTRIREDGAGVILDENNAPKLFPKKVPRYLLIKTKRDLTALEIQNVRAIVDAHVPDPEPTAAEIADARKEAELNRDSMKAFIEVVAPKLGQTEESLRTEIKQAMR